jgi:hypothetical protein
LTTPQSSLVQKLDSNGNTLATIFLVGDAPDKPYSVGQFMYLPDKTFVLLHGLVVTARTKELGGYFYAESPDRSCGVKVVGASAARDSVVTVHGYWSTVNGERTVRCVPFYVLYMLGR